MNRSLFDNPMTKSSQFPSNTKRYENWYDDQYKPLRRKIVLDTPDPILHRSASSSKQLKFFGDPSSFKSSVKRTELSQRSSNIFTTSQTQSGWKPTVKKVEAKPSVPDTVERKHVILTNYTNKYKRDPINLVEQKTKSQKVPAVIQKARNPIVDGENKQLFQRKGRQYKHDF